MKKFVYFSFVLYLTACNSKTPQLQSNGTTAEETMKDSTQYVASSEKIFMPVTPSTQYTDSIKNVLTEEEWIQLVSDNEYYRDLVAQYLEKNGYKKMELPAEENLYFKMENGAKSTINKSKLSKTWGNLIFNGKSEAFIYEGTMPEVDLKTKL